eukprot:scaffold74070_cov67-Phaeocystis_antarctica.AAC.4
MQRATPAPTPRPGDFDANRVEPAHCRRIRWAAFAAGLISSSDRQSSLVQMQVHECGGAIPKTH